METGLACSTYIWKLDRIYSILQSHRWMWWEEVSRFKAVKPSWRVCRNLHFWLRCPTPLKSTERLVTSYHTMHFQSFENPSLSQENIHAECIYVYIWYENGWIPRSSLKNDLSQIRSAQNPVICAIKGQSVHHARHCRVRKSRQHGCRQPVTTNISMVFPQSCKYHTNYTAF